MPPKKSTALKPRTSRSRVAKSKPSLKTPRKKSASSVATRSQTPLTTRSQASKSGVKQKKRVSTKGTTITPPPAQKDQKADSSDDSPGPSTPKTGEEEATGFYGLGIVRSVTQQARDFFSRWGYGFGTTAEEKTKRRKKRGPKPRVSKPVKTAR